MTNQQLHGTVCGSRGVVLVDVLVSMGFILLLIGMAQTWARAMLFAQRVFEVAVATDQDAALALARIAREIRDAGYDETNAVPPIVSGGPDHLELTADLNGDGDIDDSFEHVTYAHRVDRRQVTRSSGDGSPQPFADNVPAGGFRVSFWSASGQQVGAASSALNAAELELVRRVDVTLEVEVPNPHPGAAAPIRAAATISAALRNR
jgi:hypothetical protein